MTRRHKSNRWGKSAFTWVGTITAVVLLTATVFYHVDWSQVTQVKDRLQRVLHTHPYFSVKEITITGYQKVGGSEIVAMTGLRPGMNIWKVKPTSMEMKLNRHPWVRREVVRREFPQRVVIQIEEWEAKGIIVLGTLYYVNPEGIIFKRVEAGEKVNLPYLTGLGDEESVLNNRLARKRIAEALRLSDLFAKSSISVSEIHFLPQGGIIAYPVSRSVPLHMGWGDWPGKVQRVKRVMAEWRGREHRLASLDLSFRGQVVVRLNERT